MKLLIIDINFLNDKDWIFKLTDDKNGIYYILDTLSYKELGLKTPVNKMHLDSYLKGDKIHVEVKGFSGRNVVTSILGKEDNVSK